MSMEVPGQGFQFLQLSLIVASLFQPLHSIIIVPNHSAAENSFIPETLSSTTTNTLLDHDVKVSGKAPLMLKVYCNNNSHYSVSYIQLLYLGQLQTQCKGV